MKCGILIRFVFIVALSFNNSSNAGGLDNLITLLKTLDFAGKNFTDFQAPHIGTAVHVLQAGKNFTKIDPKDLKYDYFLKGGLSAVKAHDGIVGYGLSKSSAFFLTKAFLDAYLIYSNVRFDYGKQGSYLDIKIDDLPTVGLSALTLGAYLLGYQISGGTLALIALGQLGVKGAYTYFFENPLDGLKSKFNLDEFTVNPTKTYVTCNYLNPSDPSKVRYSAWASEDMIQINRDDMLEFHSGTLELNGRWINDKTHGASFGTIMDKIKLQSICIEVLTRYAKQNGFDFDDAANISYTAGNTRFTNHYPIHHFIPVITRGKNWSKMKKTIVKNAVLLIDKPASAQ